MNRIDLPSSAELLELAQSGQEIAQGRTHPFAGVVYQKLAQLMPDQVKFFLDNDQTINGGKVQIGYVRFEIAGTDLSGGFSVDHDRFQELLGSVLTSAQ